MSDIRQYNHKQRISSHYGTIHAFKVVDVGESRVMVQKGKLTELGPDGEEIEIKGTHGEKMVDDLWQEHETSKTIDVSEGDKLYVIITFESRSDTEEGAFTPIKEAKLEVGEPPEPTEDEKIYELANIVSAEDVDGAFTILTIEQLYHSDIVEKGNLGSASDNSSSSSDSVEYESTEVVVGITGQVYMKTITGGDGFDSEVCCIKLDCTKQKLRFKLDDGVILDTANYEIMDECCDGGSGSGSS